MKNTFLTRTLVAIPIFLTFLLIVIFQNLFFKIVLSLLLLISQYEINKAVKNKKKRFNTFVSYILDISICVTFFFFDIKYIPIIYFLMILTLMIDMVVNKKRSVKKFIYSIFVLIYPSICFIALFSINYLFDTETSRFLIFYTFLITMITDSAAYIFGSLFGKVKLCEHISPNKSVEGAVSGYAFGFLVSLLIGLFLQGLFGVEIGLIHFIILGLILPVLSQIGDLFASMIKRYFKIKDFGNVFPGHGGVLDRLDSALFIAPIVCLYFVLIVNYNLMI